MNIGDPVKAKAFIENLRALKASFTKLFIED